MKLAINEVKTQAKKLLKALHENEALFQSMQLPLKRVAVTNLEELKLKHCLSIVSHQLGFDSWQEAHEVLTGKHNPLEPTNMGSFFYPNSCGAFINEWFTDYQQAKNTLLKSKKPKWLLPYKNQYIVVTKNFIDVFKLNDNLSSLWSEIKHDMVKSYHTDIWDQITCAVIKNRTRN